MGPQTITEIKQLTEDLLQLLGVGGSVTVEVDESAVVKVFIAFDAEEGESTDRGILIGRRGETLLALQLLLGLMVNQQHDGEWLQLVVDVDDYRQRREEQLVALANRIAEKVSYLKEPVALSPMSSADRRIVHMALAEIDTVISESSGEGTQRKIVVSPA